MVREIEPLNPIASSGFIKIICPWTPWKRNIHWDDDGVGGWALNGSLDYDNGYPYVRSDDAEKWSYPQRRMVLHFRNNRPLKIIT